ncbi:MAG: TetR family transcriptional regulator [Candidatus Dactylopiibacterium carminicum]|uniref:TetR family transcriptional regulator n=1 Tax=Candidatus Dactylopiibacterium carminicum TaxID=857335 RepID=A0A272ERD2_9RHOO|nr:TetR/AcrR family transcriptional regulator [Candidatus Dactylopiibacterium carminicum]KAF7598796.1 TetR/AcrR family transcriptional regulator [Candidatus Dactylopiibacterium carminicum]PAS92677.1 MAG: TetR family transcriptional regulator [Candidatus Dactylopiibacterium carminicum]PAS94720.1 MAG: TetR family transcriptional regulator [Candidatus Dactylopiibacterium carminicum]PAS98816.1 MAG: hypothetical protein BSR46_11410 [Candidatus Dactylopiibacterium carminicum]
MRSKSESRRQTIIDEARAVFQECGFEGASMSQIAARVGGSKATLYSYFASKDELFVEVMRRSAEALMRDVFEKLDSQADLTANLRRFGEGFLEAACQPELINNYRNAYAEARKSEVGRLFYERGPRQGLLVLSEHLDACMKQGKLRQADSVVAAQHLLALLEAECGQLLLLGVSEGFLPAATRQMAGRAVEVFLRAYSTPA